MATFDVRTNCEYILTVQAENEEKALKQADKIDVSEWEQSWAPYEAERVDDAPVTNDARQKPAQRKATRRGKNR